MESCTHFVGMRTRMCSTLYYRSLGSGQIILDSYDRRISLFFHQEKVSACFTLVPLRSEACFSILPFKASFSFCNKWVSDQQRQRNNDRGVWTCKSANCFDSVLAAPSAAFRAASSCASAFCATSNWASIMRATMSENSSQTICRDDVWVISFTWVKKKIFCKKKAPLFHLVPSSSLFLPE